MDPWWDQAIPIRFHDETASRAQLSSRSFGPSPPDGVIAVGDRPVTIAARVTETFGLSGNPTAAALASRNKLESRRLLEAAGLPVPGFRPVSVNERSSWAFIEPALSGGQ